MGYNAARELMVGLGMEDIKPGETELEIWKNSLICRLIKNILENKGENLCLVLELI